MTLEDLLNDAQKFLAPLENSSIIDGGLRGATELRSRLKAYTLSPEIKMLSDILNELLVARSLFPGPNVTTLALMEEVGELAKATFEEPSDRVREEAIQVATMAMRVALDGDCTVDKWREDRGLDKLGNKSA